MIVLWAYFSRYFLDNFQPTHSPYHLYLNQSLQKRFFHSVRKKKEFLFFGKQWRVKKPRNKNIPDLIQFIITCHTFRVSFTFKKILKEAWHVTKCMHK